MPLQNRVTPFGELVAVPERGLVYGNRGCLHDSYGNIRRNHNGRRWIACRLSFRGRHRTPLLQPGHYTELFFLDEATAPAAGHRPCAECRRVDFDRFVRLWSTQHPGETGADAVDRRLHAERLQPDGRHQRRHLILARDLPDGAMIIDGGQPWLVHGDQLLRWTPGGYSDRVPRPKIRDVEVLTPPSLLQILASGWSPAVALLHPLGPTQLGRPPHVCRPESVTFWS